MGPHRATAPFRGHRCTQDRRSCGTLLAMTDPQRAAAIDRLKAKRGLTANIVSFVIVNAVLVVIWALSGAGYFWPIWVIGFWGFGLVMHAWAVYGQKPITEEDVQREMRKGGGIDS